MYEKASVVFRRVESILCKNATKEICVTDFHDYVEMLAQDNKLRLSAVYDLFSECAPCIQETFNDSSHKNCSVQPMTDSTFTCGDLSKHIHKTTMIKHTHSPIAFENAYHIRNICENCMDKEQDCENDEHIWELSNETLTTCRDVLDSGSQPSGSGKQLPTLGSGGASKDPLQRYISASKDLPIYIGSASKDLPIYIGSASKDLPIYIGSASKEPPSDI